MAVSTALDVSYGGSPKNALDFRWPDDGKPSYPTVFMVHGGWYGDEDRMKAIGEDLAAAGLCSVSVGYRDLKTVKLPSALEDIETAIAVALASSQPVDPNSWGLLGSSLGGLMTGCVATNGPDKPKTVLNLSGPSDLLTFNNPNVGDIGLKALGCDRNACPGKWTLYSPARQVTASAPPWKQFNSTDEKNPLQQAELLDQTLAGLGVEHDLKVLQGDLHAQKYWPQVRDEAIAWLHSYLG